MLAESWPGLLNLIPAEQKRAHFPRTKAQSCWGHPLWVPGRLPSMNIGSFVDGSRIARTDLDLQPLAQEYKSQDHKEQVCEKQIYSARVCSVRKSSPTDGCSVACVKSALLVNVQQLVNRYLQCTWHFLALLLTASVERPKNKWLTKQKLSSQCSRKESRHLGGLQWESLFDCCRNGVWVRSPKPSSYCRLFGI